MVKELTLNLEILNSETVISKLNHFPLIFNSAFWVQTQSFRALPYPLSLFMNNNSGGRAQWISSLSHVLSSQRSRELWLSLPDRKSTHSIQ